MKMNIKCLRALLIGILSCLIINQYGYADQKKSEKPQSGSQFWVDILSSFSKKGRKEWDQKAAESIVSGVIKKEEMGEFDWDKIPWIEDPEQAVLKARKNTRPLLVYFYLKGKTGPQAAPC